MVGGRWLGVLYRVPSRRMMKLAACLGLCLAPAAGVERRSSLVWTCGPQ